MINWISIVLITAGAFLGSEIGLRKAFKNGRTVILQPQWSYRMLTLLTIFGVALFLEAARVALATPTVRHVWLLIAGSACTFAATAVQLARELQFAKREIKRLRSGS